jgi:hypothetical protein
MKLENENKVMALPRRAALPFSRKFVFPELILFGRRVPDNQHRGGSGRNRSEPIARLRDGGACGHYVAYLLRGPLGRLLCCRQDYIFARIGKCRSAKREREYDARASNRPTA